MQIPILSGIGADGVADFRTKYPLNLIPVPKATGIAQGYLRPASGIEYVATGPGTDRGGILWNGVHYRVMGSKLVSIIAGVVTTLGDVGLGGQVTMDYGFDRLAIWSAGKLWYWNGTSLVQVVDPDLGVVIDGRWIAGYFLSTDGASLIVTELNDPMAVDPLKYGAVESDPDPVVAVDELRNEAYAMGRYTIEVFQNVGGSGFPFARIEAAQVTRGVIGTHAYNYFAETFAFVGSARNEAPAVYLMQPGSAIKISTREIDQVLAEFTEAQLSEIVVESQVDKNHENLLIHLPDRTLVYDLNASKVLGDPVWYTLSSAIEGYSVYRIRSLVWDGVSWMGGDPISNMVGSLTDAIGSHYGNAVGWEFGTQMLYNESRGAIVNEMELVGLPGRVVFGSEPTIWTSYTLDGETWSQERPISAGKVGERNKRLCWRNQGQVRNYRAQKFRGTSDAHVSFARLEMALEPLQW